MKKRRVFRRALITTVLVFAVIVAAVAFLSQGQKPLEDGAELAEGRIRVVVDGFIAAYVVELEDGDVALIDATMDTSAKAILAALQENKISASQVRAIFVTHGHGDHIGGIKAFPGADVYVLEADADLTEGRRVAGNLLGKFREPMPTGIVVTRSLQDNDIITVGGTRFEVFALPGHTLGSAAYLVHRTLFLGDSAAARSDGKIASAPPVFSADRELNQESLRKLALRLSSRQAEVDWLAFGHQGPLQGMQPLLEWARQ